MGHGGQGILPSSTSGSQSTFPRPEVGILEDSRWKKFLPRHLAIARVPAFSAAVMEEGTPKARVSLLMGSGRGLQLVLQSKENPRKSCSDTPEHMRWVLKTQD